MSPDQLKRTIAAAFDLVKDRSSEDELCIICPVPGCTDRTGNRSISTRTLYTNCWLCREPQPHHVKTLFKAVGQDWSDDQVLEASDLESLFRGQVKKAVTPVQQVELPEGFEFLHRNRHRCYWKFCADMAERKHLSIEDLEEAKAGFTREGSWEPFCIFPVYEGPRTVYYQGRTYNDEGFDKTKKFPSKKEVPYGPSYWVYNLDELAHPKVTLVIIVESILNVLSLRRRLWELGCDHEVVPVCIFTHRISRSQVAKLQRYRHVKEFCLLFDSDSTALAAQTGIALRQVLPVTVARMPHGKNPDGSPRLTNDANDDADAALYAVEERQVPTEGDVFQGRLNKVKRIGPLDVVG